MCFIYLLLLFRFFFAPRQQQLQKKKKKAVVEAIVASAATAKSTDERERTRVLVLVPRQDDKKEKKERKKKREGDKIARFCVCCSRIIIIKKDTYIYTYKRRKERKWKANKTRAYNNTRPHAYMYSVYRRHRFTIEKCQFSDVIGPRHAGGVCAVVYV